MQDLLVPTSVTLARRGGSCRQRAHAYWSATAKPLSFSVSAVLFCRCVQGFLKPTSGEQRHGSNGLLAHRTVQQRPRFFLHFFRPTVGREGVTWDGVGVETTYLTEGVCNFLLYMSYISLVKSF